ncbi:transposase [Phyllobacterium endophyticum]|nr:transposase [Phyllobacterium endophyticum]
MVEKTVGQLSFADGLVTARAGSDRLGKLSSVVKWYRFEKVLKPLDKETAAGPPAYRPLLMFKALLLQRLYGCRMPSSKRRSTTGCRFAASAGWA